MDDCTTVQNSAKAPAHYTVANRHTAVNCFHPDRLAKNLIRGNQAKDHGSKPTRRCPLTALTDLLAELAPSVVAPRYSDGSRRSPWPGAIHFANSPLTGLRDSRQNSLAALELIALPDSLKIHRVIAAHSIQAHAFLAYATAASRPPAAAVRCAPPVESSHVQLANRSSLAAARSSGVQLPNH